MSQIFNTLLCFIGLVAGSLYYIVNPNYKLINYEGQDVSYLFPAITAIVCITLVYRIVTPFVENYVTYIPKYISIPFSTVINIITVGYTGGTTAGIMINPLRKFSDVYTIFPGIQMIFKPTKEQLSIYLDYLLAKENLTFLHEDQKKMILNKAVNFKTCKELFDAKLKDITDTALELMAYKQQLLQKPAEQTNFFTNYATPIVIGLVALTSVAVIYMLYNYLWATDTTEALKEGIKSLQQSAKKSTEANTYMLQQLQQNQTRLNSLEENVTNITNIVNTNATNTTRFNEEIIQKVANCVTIPQTTQLLNSIQDKATDVISKTINEMFVEYLAGCTHEEFKLLKIFLSSIRNEEHARAIALFFERQAHSKLLKQ